MTSEERVIAALHSEHPGSALRTLVAHLAGEGHDKFAIVEAVEAFIVRYRMRPDYCDADEGVVLDVLDALHGWCHPSGALLPGDL